MSHGVKTIALPPKARILFQPARYKVLYGGRGSGKSHSVARALLIQAAQQRHRVLCTREVQKSIKDSVHKLLSDMIEELELTPFYEVLETVIRGKNGSEFIFAGLSNQTVASIKSMEGCTRVWCEEAQTISKRSWDILIPTIRREGSEIWVTFNPDLDTDETYKRFVLNPPPDCLVAFMNYSDNPYFPEVLEQERQHCKIANPDDYDNIWEGVCRPAAEGAIYAREIAALQISGRVCNVPYDPSLKVHAVWDLGWNDATTIVMCQRVRSEIRIIDYLEENYKTLDWYAAQLQAKNYNWGYDFLPHDGKHKDFKTGKSAADILKQFGRRVKFTPNLSVNQGIDALRMVFGQLYFDKSKTERLLECLKRYRRHINQATGEPGEPVHDAYSHGADAMRYMALNVERMTNELDLKYLPQFETFHVNVGGMGY